MKFLKTIIAAALLSATMAAHADLITAISHQDLKDYGNGDEAGSAGLLSSLVDCDFTKDDAIVLFDDDSKTPPSSLDISDYCYLVLHYGVGTGGVNGSGGGVEVWDVDGLTSFAVGSQNRFGNGGLSWAIAFRCCDDKTNVPDGGATLALLGGGILGIGALRRRLSK